MPLENPAIVATGTILDGKFRVNEEIGRGGMAVVYDAENVDIGKRVAVKVLSAELANSKTVTERFMREARAAAKIRSPYICDVYDVGTYQDRPFLVMELLEGESLYDRLARERRLPPVEALRIATQTARGLQQAHDASIIHRDLKPENIFLTRSGGGELSTKIVDFGLAKFYEPNLEGGANARLTKEGALFGTPAYMSPEQARAQGPIGHASDLWALGCIVYEMLVGRTVWNVDQGVAMILAQIAGGPLPTPTRVCPDLPKAFDAWFARALDRDAERRFSSARELSATLSRALETVGSDAPKPSPQSRREAVGVDALMGSRGSLPAPPLLASGQALRDLKPPVASGPPLATPLSTGSPILASRAPRFQGPGAKILIFGLVLMAVCMITAIVWVAQRRLGTSPSSASPERAPEPLEQAPYALLMSTAQAQLADGKLAASLATFEQAFEEGEKKAARSLRNHARTALEAGAGGPCQLRGLGHPRPFDRSTPSSRPTITRAGSHLLVAWSAASNPEQNAVHATVLDAALRRISTERLSTPEVIDARDPQLLTTSEAQLLLYADARGKSSRIVGRKLDGEGKPVGDAVRISDEAANYAYDPVMARAGDGTHWVAYTQATSRRVHDLFLQRVSESLVPTAPPLRLTAYARPKKARTIASTASIAIDERRITLAYRVRRGAQHQIMQLRVKPDSAQDVMLRASAPAPDDPDVESKPPHAAEDEVEVDRFAGKAVALGGRTGPEAQPRIACLEAGCVTVWSDESNGAQAALLSKDTGEVLWRRNFGEKGRRPAVAAVGRRSLVAWFENDQVRVTAIDENGVGEPSVVGWVKGLQPHPAVVAGDQPGEWYISWRSYEAAVNEPFVARVACDE